MQDALGRLKPALPQVPPAAAVTLGTSCWSICPTFSGSVIAPSRALTRAEIGLCESSQGAAWAGAAMPWVTNESTAVRVVRRRNRARLHAHWRQGIPDQLGKVAGRSAHESVLLRGRRRRA